MNKLQKLQAQKKKLQMMIQKKNKVKAMVRKQKSEEQKLKDEIKKLKVEARKDLMAKIDRAGKRTVSGYKKVRKSPITARAVRRGKTIFRNIDKQTEEMLKW